MRKVVSTSLSLLFIFLFANLTMANERDCHDRAGQRVCLLDEGFEYGVFHIIENFKVADEEPRKLIIYIPRNYAHETSKRYPVDYFFDGQSIFFPDNFIGKSWKLAQTIDALHRSQKISEFIVVGMYPLERNKEYTHANVHFQPCCGLQDHAEYVATVVKDYIDQAYRTLPDREHTSIIGSSHGGLAAFYTGTRYPDTYGKVVALSPSFWVGMFPMTWRMDLERAPLISEVKDILSDVKKRPKLWLSWGLVRTGGFHNNFVERLATYRGQELINILQKSFRYTPKEELVHYVLKDGEHDEDTWADLVPGVLQWIHSKN